MLLSQRTLHAAKHIIPAQMTLAEVRRLLKDWRVARKRSHGLTLDKLQEQSGVDRAVIHRIESVDKYPNYNPELETVLRIIDGMRMPIREFFDTELLQTGIESLTASRTATDNSLSDPQGGDEHAEPASVIPAQTDTGQFNLLVAHALIDAGTALIRAHTGGIDSAMEAPPRRQPKRGRRRPPNR